MAVPICSPIEGFLSVNDDSRDDEHAIDDGQGQEESIEGVRPHLRYAEDPDGDGVTDETASCHDRRNDPLRPESASGGDVRCEIKLGF